MLLSWLQKALNKSKKKRLLHDDDSGLFENKITSVYDIALCFYQDVNGSAVQVGIGGQAIAKNKSTIILFFSLINNYF
jgi:hypothetical protein